MAVVYGYEFPNGKWYVGFTTQKLKKRHNHHMAVAFNKQGQLKFHRALRKYEWDRSTLPVILFSGTPDEALAKEAEFAESLRAYGKGGYNTAPAGLKNNGGIFGGVATSKRIAEDPNMARKFKAIGEALASSEAAARGTAASKEKTAHRVMIVSVSGDVVEFDSTMDAAKAAGLASSPLNKKLNRSGLHTPTKGPFKGGVIGKKSDFRFMQFMVKSWADTMLPSRDVRKTAIKGCEEAVELADAISNGGSKEQIAGEIGDLLFVLLDIAHLTGVDVVQAVESRIDSNESRKWTVHNGSLKHIKE